jgi:hypothetical protein
MPMVLAVAYGLGVIGVVWFAIDSSRIPAMVWFWSGYSRLGWWTTMAVALIALGIPAFVAAIVWRTGDARRALFQEVDELKGAASRRAHMDRSTRNIT